MSSLHLFNKSIRLFKYNSSFNYRYLNTWSPLATSFNTRPRNQFSFSPKKGLFCIDELREEHGFELLKENAGIEVEALLFEATKSRERSRKMVEIFDHLSNSLCKVADMSEFVRIAHPDEKYASRAESACLSVSHLVEKLNTNQELYLALKNVIGHRDIVETDEVDEHVAKLFLSDFEQSGIHLDTKKRAQVVYLNELILYTGQKFSANSTRANSVPTESIPNSVRNFFPYEDGKYVVSGLFSDAYSEWAREAAYRSYLLPNSEQDQLLLNLLSARNQLAITCGFPSYAHRALQGSLAESPTLVAKFLEDLGDKLNGRAERDYSLMTKMKGNLVQVWDPPYFTSEAKRNLLNVDRSDFMPYLSIGACMDGLNHLCQILYNTELVHEEVEPGEVWHNLVYKLSVVHKDEGKLGTIYCDFFERDEKPHQDCHFTIQGGKLLEDGTYQNPIVVLMLNFPPSSKGIPSLLTPSMVDNLFHEMGHALHSMMARTKYQHVTGTRCTTDFAEIPSILMEYFASDPRVLSKFARHYETGEKMADALLEKYSMAKNIFAASDMQLQNFYAALDQTLHTERFPLQKSTTEILETVHTKFYGLPYVPNTAWHLRFGHLVGYGAKYYSYLMSRAVASWIWQEYFQSNPLCSSSGEKYRRELLAHGGGVPPKKLVSNFLGKDITSHNLTEALISDLDSNQKKLESFLEKL